LKEAAKLGFARALAPQGAISNSTLPITGVKRLAEAVSRIGEGAWS
jgi:DNA repair protein RadA/Sms